MSEVVKNVRFHSINQGDVDTPLDPLKIKEEASPNFKPS